MQFDFEGDDDNEAPTPLECQEDQVRKCSKMVLAARHKLLFEVLPLQMRGEWRGLPPARFMQECDYFPEQNANKEEGGGGAEREDQREGEQGEQGEGTQGPIGFSGQPR